MSAEPSARRARREKRRRLRASYVWGGAVQADVLARRRRPVTIGPRTDATFFTPDFDLSPGFPILAPHRRGATLWVVPGMTGTACADGEVVDIAEFLDRPAGERETPGDARKLRVGPGDWGVIELDGRGDHVLFFHFAEEGPRLGGARLRDPELLWPALAFTLVLFLILIGATYLFPRGPERLEGRELIADYLVNRPDPEEDEITLAEDALSAGDEDEDAEAAGARAPADPGEAPEEDAPRGERSPSAPEAEAPTEDDRDIPEEIQRGLLQEESRDAMRRAAQADAVDERLGDALDDLDEVAETASASSGGRIGTRRQGDAAGGGGEAHADAVSQGELDTGGTREAEGVGGAGDEEAVEVQVQTQPPQGDLGGLTREEISRVVQSRQNAIRACYERQLQRHPNLAGRVVMQWEIGPGGDVTRARVRNSSLNHGATEDCILRQIRQMDFPSPGEGQRPVVNFPFVFDQQ